MKGCPLRFGLLEGSVLFCLSVADPTAAQIVPDATLPNNTTVNLQGTRSVIEGGTTAGSNLFHSFQEFSVPTGGEAFFNNTGNIQNIFSRVTGGSITSIDGLIRANGTANLFLLNPNGIVFGSNARLNIGGSFFGSSASSISFADGYEFSATNPNTPPLLTINVPIGLQIGSNPGRIVNQSTGEGLQVLPGKTLALIGGNVQLDNGILFAPGGRVELGGLATPGTVSLNADSSLSFPTGVQRADVSLINGSAVDVSAGGGGSIAVTANNVEIAGRSGLIAGIGKGWGSIDAMAGDIDINSTGAIVIANDSFAINSVDNQAIGNGGDINIAADSLSLTNKGLLSTATFGQGKAGNIAIAAIASISFDGGSAFSTVETTGKGDGGNINIITNSLSATKSARLVTGTRGQGNAGSINITANSLTVTGGAQLNASTRGEGNAGSVTIDARDRVAFDGLDSQGLPSGAFSNVGETGVGNASGINITTNELSVTNDAQLLAGSKGQGNAGNINIIARDRVVFSGSGAAFSSVEETGKGEGGSINITTNSLALTNKAQLFTGIRGQGKAGNIVVNASSSVSLDGLSSGLFSRLEETGKGEGGSININTRSLSVTNDAQLNTSTRGQGNAGNITINARDRIWFSSNGAAFSFVAQTAMGDAGDININTNSLSLTNGAALIASTLGQGSAGDLIVNARDTVSFDRGSTALSSVGSTAKGNGGSIRITTGELSVTNGAQLFASTRGQGNAGSVTIDARRVSFDGVDSKGFPSGAFSAVESKAVGNATEIDITTSELFVTNGAQLQAVTNGQGNAGNITIDARESVSFDSGGAAFSDVGKTGVGIAGGINITTNQLFVGNNAQLVVGIKGQGKAGDLIVNARDRVSFNGGDAFSSVELGAKGDGGSIKIEARELSVTNGGQLIAGTKGQGNAGNITVIARDRALFDGDSVSFDEPIRNASGVISSVETTGVGDGGNINIITNDLFVTNGGQLRADTEGQGKAGNVIINASSSVTFDGVSRNRSVSAAFSAVNKTAIGEGGNITITTDSLFVTNGAQLIADTLGQGKAGSVIVNARQRVMFDGFAAAFSGVGTTGVGDGGNISIVTRALGIVNGAQLNTNSEGNGAAGNIEIQANSIFLDNNAEILANTVKGQGNITLQTPLLILRRNSNITTNATGSAIVGGNITIDADVFAALENSDISANSDEFEGGNVTINTQAIFGTQPRAATTPESDITATGRTKAGTVTINTPDVDPSSGLIELPANLVDITGLIAPDCPIGTRYAANEFFITGRGGLPPNPREALSQNALDVGWVNPNSQAQEGRGVEEQGSRGTGEPHTEIVEATGWVKGANGEVILTANVPNATPRESWYRSILCPAPRLNN